jgi:predicted polyphosphate/ATP-dependent NAD kinase
MNERFRVGFLVNPIAGLGGRPGLKGSDDATAIQALAGSIDAEEIPAYNRALDFLTDLILKSGVAVAAPGPMGEGVLKKAMSCGGPIFEVAREPGGSKRFGETTREDTIRMAKRLLREQIDLLVFVGGDGTAVDVATAVEGQVPILGVPAGVKMFSGVFAETPATARRIVQELRPGFRTEPADVIDLDESSYKAGAWHVRSHATAKVPIGEGVQVSKGGDIPTEGASQADLVEWFKGAFDPATTYVLGAGTTIAAIKQHLGGGSPLGVDVFRGDAFVATDASEEQILAALDDGGPARILVSPTGRQGAVLGRGTAQVSPAVLERVGVQNVVILATPAKLLGIDHLFVDTGDPGIDAKFGEYVKVRTDPWTEKVFRLRRGGRPDGH